MPLQRIVTDLRFRFLVRRSNIERQVGAIPYSLVEGQPAILLITSRRTRRWIVPKGGLMEGLTPAQAAAQEALEEAGVEGSIDHTPVGVWRTIKRRGVRLVPLEVELYPLLVTQQHDTWLEESIRQRHWSSLREAQSLITDKHLLGVIENLKTRL